MKIVRKDNTIIQKRRIPLEQLEDYNEEKIKEATKLLQKCIDEHYVNHYDFVSYILEEKEHNLSKYNKKTGCISEARKLKKLLTKINMKTYYVSCASRGYSTQVGDAYIKESHVFLVYPCRKNNKTCFILFDPGLRISSPILFMENENSKKVPYLIGYAQVTKTEKDDLYPYQVQTTARLLSNASAVPEHLLFKFNPYYETQNMRGFEEACYKVFFSYKLMNYTKNLEKSLCIRSNLLKRKIEISTKKEYLSYSFADFENFTPTEIAAFFQKWFDYSSVSSSELHSFSKNLYLLIHSIEEYTKKVLAKEVVEDYYRFLN